jgi:hypothetical protein
MHQAREPTEGDPGLIRDPGRRDGADSRTFKVPSQTLDRDSAGGSGTAGGVFRSGGTPGVCAVWPGAAMLVAAAPGGLPRVTVSSYLTSQVGVFFGWVWGAMGSLRRLGVLFQNLRMYASGKCAKIYQRPRKVRHGLSIQVASVPPSRSLRFVQVEAGTARGIPLNSESPTRSHGLTFHRSPLSQAQGQWAAKRTHSSPGCPFVTSHRAEYR